MTRKASYSSAPCGAGKTFGMCDSARKALMRGRNVLMIQPTKLLADLTAENEFRQQPNCPPIHVFHGDTVGRGVGRQLADHLAETGDEPQVVIATHQVLTLLTHRTNFSNWALMIDESPQVDSHKAHSLLQTHDFLTDCIEIDPVDDVYGRVVVAHQEQLIAIGRNEDEDELWGKLQETARILQNGHWVTYVRLEQYDRLLAGTGRDLTFHSLLQPTVIEGFASVFVAAANFEDSAAYHLWRRKGVRWKENTEFTKNLRFDGHQNGHLATIYYATEQDWSRKLGDKIADGISNLDRVRNGADTLLDSSTRLWQGNVRLPDGFFRGVRLPNNPLGLNIYSDVDDLAFLSALNPTPDHARFLGRHGFTRDQISRMNYCSTLYQAAMRTSLRDPDSTTRKRIVVFDRRAAEFLREKLPGSDMQKLETSIIEAVKLTGRPRVHTDNAEKSRRRRELESEKRRRMILDMMSIGTSQDHPEHCEGAKLRTENGIDLITHFDTQHPYHGTIFKHKKSALANWYLYCETPEAFICAMEFCSQQKHPTKEAVELISPAIFDPDRVLPDSKGKRTRRGRANIEYLQNIMLDFEKGDLRPDQFAELFPDLQMVITNTYSHTSDHPRFRVIIPTSQRMTPDVYEAIFDEIEQRMEDQGVLRMPLTGSNCRKSGRDHSKRSAASLFFLPCQAKIAEESFFDVYVGPGRQPLNPEVWMQTARFMSKGDIEFIPIQPRQCELDQTRVDAAVSKWRHETLPEEGNHQFYLFGAQLKKLGMSDYEIEAKLREEAQYGRSQAERKAQIPSIMTSLAEWEWQAQPDGV